MKVIKKKQITAAKIPHFSLHFWLILSDLMELNTQSEYILLQYIIGNLPATSATVISEQFAMETQFTCCIVYSEERALMILIFKSLRID